MAEACTYVYMLQVIYKGTNTVVRKDLGELVEFMREIDQLFNGFIDIWLCQLLDDNSNVTMDVNYLASEFDKSIK